MTELKRKVEGQRPSCDETKNLLLETSIVSVLRRLFTEGIPQCFSAKWEHWEFVRNFISDYLRGKKFDDINPLNIRLVGSRNQGFRFRSREPYADNSDFDWVIVSASLFDKLYEWFQKYEQSRIEYLRSPKSDLEWAKPPEFGKIDPLDQLQKWSRRNFLQSDQFPSKMPEKILFQKMTQNLRNELHKREIFLCDPRIIKMSYRVYADWSSAEKQWRKSLDEIKNEV